MADVRNVTAMRWELPPVGLTALVIMIVNTSRSSVCCLIRQIEGLGKRRTWFIGVVIVELGRHARQDAHLDEEHDGVQ